MVNKRIKIYGNELYHFGIKGQKWGERNYQYEDGSLTPEGKIRYGNNSSVSNNKKTSAHVTSPTRYKSDDTDFDDKNYSEENRVSDTDFFMATRSDGSKYLLEEDMKWDLPSNISKEILGKHMKNFENEIRSIDRTDPSWTSNSWEETAAKHINAAIEEADNEKTNKPLTEEEIDAYAKDVIKGKYGNGQERKKALGSNYSIIQKKVNEMLKHSAIRTEKTIYHSGIKGQKWGNRRYQNEDGTYTEEGKIRRRKGSEDYLKVKEIKKKSIKSMSNKELQDANNRMNLERTYKQNTQSLGKKLVDKYMNKVAEKSMEALAVATVAAGTVFIKKVLGK